MAFGVLTTNTMGAGAGARRRRAATTRAARRRRRRSRWRSCSRSSTLPARAASSRHDARRRDGAGTAPARRRCRCSISGRSARAGAHEAIATFWPAQRRRRRRRRATLREFANALARGTLERLDEIDALIADARAELAPRADGGARSADPAAGDLRAAGRAGHAAAGGHQRGARAGAHVQRRGGGAFVNGVLDARAARRCGRGNESPSSMSDEHDPANPNRSAQRRANLEELSALGVDAVSAPVRAHRTRSTTLVAAHGAKTGDELEAERVETSTAGRILAIRSFGKANFLVLSDGARADPGLHPAGRAAASATSRSSSCSTSATGSASKGACSAPRPTS